MGLDEAARWHLAETNLRRNIEPDFQLGQQAKIPNSLSEEMFS